MRENEASDEKKKDLKYMFNSHVFMAVCCTVYGHVNNQENLHPV